MLHLFTSSNERRGIDLLRYFFIAIGILVFIIFASTKLSGFFRNMHYKKNEKQKEKETQRVCARIKQKFGENVAGLYSDATRGRSRSQFEYGNLFFEGNKVPQDYSEAFRWFRKAADRDYPSAYYMLGLMYLLGKGVSQSYENAYDMFVEACNPEPEGKLKSDLESKLNICLNELVNKYKTKATAEDPHAMLWLSKCYHFRPDKQKEAFLFLEKAAEKNYPEACMRMGLAFRLSWYHLDKDEKKAFAWINKAASLNYEKSFYYLAGMYHDGIGTTQNYSKAFEMYQKMACKGNARAQFRIGVMYFEGRGRSIDNGKAFEFLKMATDHGSEEAQAYLAYLFYTGKGTVRDQYKAVDMAIEPAERGIALAQAILGYAYLHGVGTYKDTCKGVEWTEKAAEQGRDDSLFQLGEVHEKGVYYARDLSKAMEYYKKAADMGNEDAKERLSVIEIKLLEEAARNNDAMAMYKLGSMYETGKGVHVNYDKAREWYLKASNSGDSRIDFVASDGVFRINKIQKERDLRSNNDRSSLKEEEDPDVIRSRKMAEFIDDRRTREWYEGNDDPI